MREIAAAPRHLADAVERRRAFRKATSTHFPGFYETGDAGMIDEDGYLYIMARTDDVINVAGHRLSTGGMEEVLAAHPDVAECAVIGVTDQLERADAGWLFVPQHRWGPPTARLSANASSWCATRSALWPLSNWPCVVDRLPKTRSGKILRGTWSRSPMAKAFKMPATIDDPAILD